MKRTTNKDPQEVPARAGLRAVKLQELLFGVTVHGAGGPALGTTLPRPLDGGNPKYPDDGGE